MSKLVRNLERERGGIGLSRRPRQNVAGAVHATIMPKHLGRDKY